jgi:hypothetical protein
MIRQLSGPRVQVRRKEVLQLRVKPSWLASPVLKTINPVADIIVVAAASVDVSVLANYELDGVTAYSLVSYTSLELRRDFGAYDSLKHFILGLLAHVSNLIAGRLHDFLELKHTPGGHNAGATKQPSDSSYMKASGDFVTINVISSLNDRNPLSLYPLLSPLNPGPAKRGVTRYSSPFNNRVGRSENVILGGCQ